MLVRLALVPLLLVGCVDAGGDEDEFVPPGGGKGDDFNRSADDVHLVLAEVVDLAQVHFGDVNTNHEHPDVVDAVSTNIGSERCEYLAQQFPFSEFDCSAALLADIAMLRPAIAGAPLIYPAIHRGGFNQNAQPALDRWESNNKLVRIVVAVKRAAGQASSFAGIGFHRVGYEFRAELPDHVYAAGSRGEELFRITNQTNALVSGPPKYVGEGKRASDGVDVLFFEYVYFLPQNVKRPWITGGYEWLPGSSGVMFKPFAEFHADGHVYRNWDPRGVTYRVERDAQPGFAVDYRSHFSGV